jgi:predicted signal transduction protein with EAL and GGDEF domain
MTTDALLAKILHHEFLASEDLLRAAIIPLLIAPFLSWYLVGLLFELDHLEQKMSLLATYDDLTGLLNRRAFFDSCEVLHKYSIRNKQNYSLLSVDIDYF